MGKLKARPFNIIVNRAARLEHVRQDKVLPEAIRELKIEAIHRGDRITSLTNGAIELAFWRGYHSGYIVGYKDAKQRKKSTYDLGD